MAPPGIPRKSSRRAKRDPRLTWIFVILGITTMIALSVHWFDPSRLLPNMREDKLVYMGLFWFSLAGLLKGNVFNLNTALTRWLGS